LNSIQRFSTGFQTENDLAHGEGIVDNNGVFYLPAYTPTGSRNYADQVWLLMLPQGARRFYARELPLNDKYCTNIYMKIDNVNNRIYTGGFYSDRKNGNYEGVLYAYFNLADS